MKEKFTIAMSSSIAKGMLFTVVRYSYLNRVKNRESFAPFGETGVTCMSLISSGEICVSLNCLPGLIFRVTIPRLNKRCAITRPTRETASQSNLFTKKPPVSGIMRMFCSLAGQNSVSFVRPVMPKGSSRAAKSFNLSDSFKSPGMLEITSIAMALT